MSEPIWSAQAEADLEEIVLYLRRRNLEAAQRVHAEILDRVQRQAQFPLTGRVRDAWMPGLRSVSVTPYVVVFRVVADTIEVVRVLHGSRDVARIVREETEL